jgi:hypothetical protein
MSQSFELESGQALSLQDAESQALNNLGPNRVHQTYQSQSGRQYLEALKELNYSIAAWPEGFCQSELLAGIFGPVHFDARSLKAQETCHLEAQDNPDSRSLMARVLAWVVGVLQNRSGNTRTQLPIGPNTIGFVLVPIGQLKQPCLVKAQTESVFLRKCRDLRGHTRSSSVSRTVQDFVTLSRS